MFDRLVKRSNSVWIYKTGRFAGERRVFLCDLSERGHGYYALRHVNRLLLAIAERVNVRQRMPITGVQIARAANNWIAKFCAPNSNTETRENTRKRFVFVAKNWFFPRSTSGILRQARVAALCRFSTRMGTDMLRMIVGRDLYDSSFLVRSNSIITLVRSPWTVTRATIFAGQP